MRRLGAEEKALWEKVVASVRPLHARQKTPAEKPEPVSVEPPLAEKPRVIARPQPRAAAPKPGVTLDAGWDRRLARGVVQPDIVVDLHGHNLANAYHLLDLKLEQAVAIDARVMLLVTGKPPSDERRPGQRGAIRAAVGDWLSASRHAAHIAAVRNAHPRHGGAGALYIILRRRRGA